MTTLEERISAASTYLKPLLPPVRIALVLGSGLGSYGEQMESPLEIPYADIPGFPVSTVPGHAGKLICGKIEGIPVLVMSGRFHYYEGLQMSELALPIRVFRMLGVGTVILTNAAGGVNRVFRPGDLMLLTDHINLSGSNPLIGPNDDRLGPRFPDLSHAYTPALQELARACARDLGIQIREGVYCMMSGPCYETPAEIRMVRMLGGDAVGMSTVPEVIAAAHCGMNVVAFSSITNMAAGILDKPITHSEVIESGKKGARDFAALITELIKRIP